MARKKKPEEHVNHERWLVSYADFITLLFAFFTTMYAISTVDAQKMGKMVMSMRASFESSMFEAGSPTLSLGQGAGGSGTAVKGPDMVEEVSLLKSASSEDEANPVGISRSSSGDAPSGQQLALLKQAVEARLAPEIGQNRVQTYLDKRGLTISIREVGLFDSGSDQIRPDGRDLLERIAGSLPMTENHVRVEGHTDNVPIRTSRFPSNWELSTARATSVVAYLVTRFKMTPNLLSAAGYAEHRPVGDNKTADGRARNRRVDIVVIDPRMVPAEPR